MSALHKIVFTGPVGAGKTTAIGSISDIEPVSTEAHASDETAERKDQTTVAMDYGTLQLDGGATLHLYGTPGQDRFDFMWDVLTEGGFGLVIMVDNARERPLDDLAFYVDAFGPFIRKTGVAIGVTRMDIDRTTALDDYATRLRELDLDAPVFEVDARSADDVKTLLAALLVSLDPLVNRRRAAERASA